MTGFNFVLFASGADGAFLALKWDLVSTIPVDALEYLTAVLPVGNPASLDTFHSLESCLNHKATNCML